MRNFHIEIDADGVALVRFDVPGKSMNVIGAEVQREFDAVLDAIRADGVRGAVLYSGKSSGFCAGADLGELLAEIERWRAARSQDELRRGIAESGSWSRRLRALETCGKPVAAAIHGPALGGGLELALACHHRVAVDDPTLRLALPEASVGLLPGAGGTQRLPRLIGLAASLPHLLDGLPIAPAAALAGGVLHALVPAEALVETARRWVLDAPTAVAPWDDKGYKLPGGGPHTPAGYGVFAPAMAARLGGPGEDVPAIGNILKCVYEGAQLPMDAALRVEARYFFNTLRSAAARGMIRTRFVARQALARRGEREDVAPCLAALRDAAAREQQAMRDEGVGATLVANLARLSCVGGAPAAVAPSAAVPAEVEPVVVNALKRRLLYAQALAAARCLAERMVLDPMEADSAAVGAGFPVWTGGPLSYIDLEGPAHFVQQAEQFAARHGERFAVPAALREAAAAGHGYYD
ncbi:MAG TPA: enoyl-CoA hydratase-related protein [Methylibium sp.]|nr:enoyl-CoA hydratase-related protein [Methylibium sp.]